MTLAIAHHVGSFEALDRQLDYTAISDDPEDYQRCIARERTLEMQICQDAGFPCFLIVDTLETQGIRVSGEGYQNPFRHHLLYDSARKPVDSLSDYEVLVRTHVGAERSVLSFIEGKGGRNVADWKSQEMTLVWYKHVKPDYLKRNLAWFPMEGIFQQDLNRFKDDKGRFFCKTNFKVRGFSGVTDDLMAFFGYLSEIMPPSTEIIVSEPLELLTETLGKLEYRCYVVGKRVSSISRYRDYDIDYAIPQSIERFAAAFVTDHQGILPECYVLDVAESERGPVVIELNGIVASGRYEKNNFRKLLNDLGAA